MFGTRSNGEQRKGEEENPFLLSFSDLMAGLLAIFILALIVMMIQLHRKQQELEKETKRMRITLEELIDHLEEIERIQSDVDKTLSDISFRERSLAVLLEEIRKDLEERGIIIIVAENGSVLRIPEKALSFELGSYKIREEFHPAADAIGTALALALEREENMALLDTVFIEGHTDAVPNIREMGNWGLSTYRAISLWQFWTEDPGRLSRLRELKTFDRPGGVRSKPLISVSGYADTRPTGVEPSKSVPDTEEPEKGNPADRRIDIRFTISSSEKENLEQLQEKLGSMRSKTRGLIEQLKAHDE